MKRTLTLGLLALLAASSAVARAPQTRFDAADLSRLVGVSDPVLSKDGTFVVYTVTSTNLAICAHPPII